MGILNVTPDSFSDGGAYFATGRAIDHGLALAADGADTADVGGESTRPGARPVPLAEELSRGGLADPLMAATAASAGVPYVAMHWRAPSRKMHDHAVYCDVAADVVAELRRRAGELMACGVGQDQIVLDPGLGFAKRPAHDWPLLAHLGELQSLGFPLRAAAAWNSPSGGEKGGDHAICGAVPGGVPAP